MKKTWKKPRVFSFLEVWNLHWQTSFGRNQQKPRQMKKERKKMKKKTKKNEKNMKKTSSFFIFGGLKPSLANLIWTKPAKTEANEKNTKNKMKKNENKKWKWKKHENKNEKQKMEMKKNEKKWKKMKKKTKKQWQQKWKQKNRNEKNMKKKGKKIKTKMKTKTWKWKKHEKKRKQQWKQKWKQKWKNIFSLASVCSSKLLLTLCYIAAFVLQTPGWQLMAVDGSWWQLSLKARFANLDVESLPLRLGAECGQSCSIMLNPCCYFSDGIIRHPKTKKPQHPCLKNLKRALLQHLSLSLSLPLSVVSNCKKRCMQKMSWWMSAWRLHGI